jgi:predicted nucleic acid-binding protein
LLLAPRGCQHLDVDDARRLLEDQPALSSRDALHAAAMIGAGVRRIVSFDAGFDQVTGIKRIEPR